MDLGHTNVVLKWYIFTLVVDLVIVIISVIIIIIIHGEACGGQDCAQVSQDCTQVAQELGCARLRTDRSQRVAP